MNKKFSLTLSIILIVLGAINSGIFLVFALIGSFACGKPFFAIDNGGEGPILGCTSIFNTNLVLPILLGICLILIGIILIVLRKENKKI